MPRFYYSKKICFDLNFLAQYDITFDKFNEASARKGLDLIKKKLIYNIVRSEK